jgi:hypothetical protein
MNRAIVYVLIASFALFAGSPVMADMIFSAADGSTEAVSDVSSKAVDLVAQPGIGPEAPAPDQVQRVASPEAIGMAALVVFLVSAYVFGATDHPHPGW